MSVIQIYERTKHATVVKNKRDDRERPRRPLSGLTP